MQSKPNISLANLSEVHTGGLLLTVRKGINELLRRRNRHAGLTALPYPSKEYKPIISIIICTANDSELSLNVVNSIIRQGFDKKLYEIIIVNNSGKPFTNNLSFPDIKIVNESILGLSKARNTGASVANGEFLLYIDDDAVANDGLLDAIYSAFLKHTDYAIIGGQIFLKLPDPVPNVFLEGKEGLWSAYTVPYKSFREAHEQYEFPYGACFGIRHSILDALGGFPESYGRKGNDFAGGEEIALCFAAKKLCLKVGLEPSASVTHLVSPSRFTREHIRYTTRAGILTTYKLYEEGYAPYGWSKSYIIERLRITELEMERADERLRFYKKCEYDAFAELLEYINNTDRN